MKRLFRLSVGERGVRRDVSSEIAFHIEMRTRELIDAGVPPDEARARALATFGDVAAVEDECRGERRRHVRRRDWRERVQSVAQDIHYAVRTLRRSPGFTVTALVTLALGIGANSAIFSMVDGVLLRRPAYGNVDRLIGVERSLRSLSIEDIGFSAPDVADFRRMTPSIDGLAEYHSMSFDLLGHGDPRRVATGVVSADYFRLLGVKPFLGRTFLDGEDQVGAAPVLVLSYRFWLNQLGGDSSIVGKTFTMNDRQHAVVGVLPPLPNFPDENDVYMPISSCPFRSSPQMANARDMRMVSMIARLKPGATLDRARRDLSAVEARLHASYPAAYRNAADAAVVATPIRDMMSRTAAPAFLLLLGIAGLVLLVACANVAHLTLARQLKRQRELAIRVALGAGRQRILRQLLTESILLSVAGGVIGLGLANTGIGVLARFAARFSPRADEIVLDWRVVLFTLVVSLLTGVVFGIIPAMTGNADVAGRLHGGSATAAGTTRLRARGALVVGEVAVAFVVLVGAGLMLRSFARLMTTNLGYDPQNVVTAHVDLNWTKYRARESSAQFAQSLMDRLRSASGIRAVAVANAFPASSTTPQNKSTFDIRGMPASDSARQPKAEVNIVSPEYFRAIGVPLRAGRAFTDADRDTSAVVAVVSQATAHRYFANGDALGKQITLDNGKHWFTIVGVVGDVRQFGPATEVPEQVYLPYAVFPTRDVRVLVRTAGAPLVAVNLIRETVRGLDAQQPVIDIRTLEQARQDSIASPKLTTILLALFAVLALIIAAAGLGGVMAYSVGQRTQEFGLRMALGAERGSVLRLVLGQGVRLVVAGLVVGVLASRLSAHAIAKLLYGVQAGDPLTYGGVAAVFIVVAILACLAPARRATSVDPVSALKAG